jgi:hypothetical protein
MDKVWAIWAAILPVISSVEFWKITAPTTIAVIVWILTERSKARWEQFKLKEGNYKGFVSSLKPLYGSSRAKLDNSEQLNEGCA